MMSHANDNNNSSLSSKPAAGKDDNHQTSASRKTSTAARPQEPTLKCPRCDSPNTKFCYYNNYSLTQPRHFCKTCRRYWTRGGALRNVPIGGGCRKNKKMKSSSMVSGDSKDSGGSSSDIGGLKFFQGISPAVPAMDFQLGGLNINIPSNHGFSFNNLSSLGNNVPNNTSTGISSNPSFNFDGNSSHLMGFGKFPLYSELKQGDVSLGFQEMGSNLNFNHSNLASSIESLSSINQDLHWKLQQQRLSMLFVGDHNNQSETIEHNVQKPQPILFQNLEIDNSKIESCEIGSSRKDGGNGSLATEWYFDNSCYVTTAINPTTPAATNASTNLNESGSSNWSGGIQTWSELSHFSSLP